MKLTYSQLRIVLCVVAAASVAGAAAAPLATEADAALSGVTIREESRQVPADRIFGINADCNSDEGPLAGGLRWAAGSSLLNNRILFIEPRSQSRSGIRSVIRDNDPGGTDTAVAIAICAPDAGLPTIRVRDAEGEASGGPQTASCDPGEIAVGGSVLTQSGAAGMQAIAESRPTDVDGDGVASSWTGRYLNDSDPDGLFLVQVLCAEPSDAFTVEVATSPQIPYPPGALAAATAVCPQPDQIAIGGGIGSSGAANVANGLVASQPGALVDGQPRSWTVIGAAPADAPPQMLDAYVMCTTQAPPQPPPAPPADPDSDGDGVPDAADQCPNVAGPSANGGCPTSSPPPSLPGASVAFESGPKLRLTRKGVAKLALGCSADAGQRCEGALTVKGAKGKAKRILNAKPVSFSIPAETTQRLKLKLSPKAHELVRRAGRRGAKANITATLAGQARGVDSVVRLVGRGSRPTLRRSSTTAGADGRQITHQRKGAHQR